jgi:hypothetical protein
MFVALVFVLGAWSAGGNAGTEGPRLHPPAVVLRQLDALTQVDRVTELPVAIQSGAFADRRAWDGTWVLAEPRGKWNVTDVVDPSLPSRRLVFGACAPTLCLIHYERGGVAHTVHVLAVARSGDRWWTIWHASGYPLIADLSTLRSVVRNETKFAYLETSLNDI